MIKKIIDYATATSYIFALTVGMYGFMTENLAIAMTCVAVYLPLHITNKLMEA